MYYLSAKNVYMATWACCWITAFISKETPYMHYMLCAIDPSLSRPAWTLVYQRLDCFVTSKYNGYSWYIVHEAGTNVANICDVLSTTYCSGSGWNFVSATWIYFQQKMCVCVMLPRYTYIWVKCAGCVKSRWFTVHYTTTQRVCVPRVTRQWTAKV